jgi:cytochrome P450
MATTDVRPDFGLEPFVGDELHDVLRALRAEHRVAPIRFHGMDAVLFTRFDDVREMFRDDEHFPGGDFYQGAIEPVVGPTFISMNGHDHDVHRKMATPAFRSRAVTRFDEAELVPLAHEVLDRFADRGEGDLFAELCTVLPYLAITRKLGVPPGAEADMRRWADTMLTFPSDPDGAVTAAGEFSTELAPLLAERRVNPGEDDILSALTAVEHDGDTLDDEEVSATVRLLFAVGATTTSHAMGNLLWTLLGRPELLARAHHDPSIRAGIIHELLRWEGPLPTLPRVSRHEATFDGVTIPAGSLMLFGLASANRDAAAFGDDADAFDADRAPHDILTFGFGAKFCPGSHLARRELLTALDAVLERFPGLRLVDPEGSEPRGGVLRHPEALHCAWKTR